MARNTGNNNRKGAVTGRSQVYNPATGHYVKRDTETGRFIEVKADGKPFKGVAKEASSVRANPNIKQSLANKVEKAVIAVKNKSKK